MGNIDWEKIYAEFDGDMNACLGKSCPASCCRPKEIYVYKKPNKIYLTSFVELSEWDYQRTLQPNYEELGVEVGVFDIGKERSQYQILVNKCLDAETGCKLKANRPFVCRIYPFRVTALNPVYSDCPQIIEMIEDEKVIAHILEIRRLLGWKDNDVWLKNIHLVKSQKFQQSF